MPARRVVRDVNEAARDVARELAKTEALAHSRRDRKKIEMLFAHLKRILRLDRTRPHGQSRLGKTQGRRDRRDARGGPGVAGFQWVPSQRSGADEDPRVRHYKKSV
jgi:hypothetical protein